MDIGCRYFIKENHPNFQYIQQIFFDTRWEINLKKSPSQFLCIFWLQGLAPPRPCSMAVKKIALFGAMGGPSSPPGQAVQVGYERTVLAWNTSSTLPAEGPSQPTWLRVMSSRWPTWQDCGWEERHHLAAGHQQWSQSCHSDVWGCPEHCGAIRAHDVNLGLPTVGPMQCPRDCRLWPMTTVGCARYCRSWAWGSWLWCCHV